MTGRLSEDRLMEPLVINGRRRGVVRRALVGLALTAGCVYALVQGRDTPTSSPCFWGSWALIYSAC